ncbi:MAG: LiaF transmembrane domain-containing protein [Gammaproteobacteria bacterium]
METPESKHAYRYAGGLVTGIIVIIVGVFFLLDNLGIDFGFMRYHNWWALFILIGAVGPLSYAVQRYRKQGKMDAMVLHSVVSSVSIITVALIFLLDLSWNLWWPLFIIYGGLYMLVNHWKNGPGTSSS